MGGFAGIFKASRYPNGALNPLNKGSGSGMGGQDSDWQVGMIGQKASTVPPMLVPNGASTCKVKITGLTQILGQL